MLYPEINKLRDVAGSRYFLVSMASKRARDIIDGREKLDESINTNKPVSIAAEEIAENLFTYHQIESIEETEETEAPAEETEAVEAGEEETYTPDYGQAEENLPEETGENQIYL